VVAHETVSVTQPMMAFVGMLECVQKAYAVLVVFKDGLLYITARRDVIYCVWVFYAKRSYHIGSVALSNKIVNDNDLSPLARAHAR
jgi:hypothetical protein